MRKKIIVMAVTLVLLLSAATICSANVFPTFGQDTEVYQQMDMSEFRGQALQCTDYVYSLTGIPRGMGNAERWDESAKARKYTVSSTPVDRSIGVINAWNSKEGKYGHVYYCEDSTKKDHGMYKMDIKHANWEKSGAVSKYTDAQFDKNTTKVSIHGGKWLPSGGFITKWPGRK